MVKSRQFLNLFLCFSILFLGIRNLSAQRDRSNKVTLLETPKVAAEARLDLIRNADREILVSTHIFKEDISGKTFLGEVFAAAKRGVKVKLLIDGVGDNLSASMKKALVASGVELYFFRPLKPGYLLDINRRMHDKLFIVDRESLILGDRNFKDAYYSIDKASFSSKDFYFEGHAPKDAAAYFDELIQNEAVEKFIYEEQSPSFFVREKIKTLVRYSKKRKKAFITLNDDWKKNLMVANEVDFFHDNVDLKGISPGTEEPLLEMIRNAKKRLIIENPYIILTEKFQTALQESVAKNPQLQIIVVTNSVESNDIKLAGAAWEESFEFLQKLNATVYEHNVKSGGIRNKWSLKSLKNRVSSSSAVHAKILVADDEFIVSSFNLDPRSEFHNLEVMMRIRSPEMTEKVAGLYQQKSLTNFTKTMIKGVPQVVANKASCIRKALAKIFKNYL